LRPGQHVAPQGFEFKSAVAQPLTGLQDITSKPDPQGGMFIPRLVFPLEGFEEVAAVAVEDGNRDRHAHEELVSAKFLGAFPPTLIVGSGMRRARSSAVTEVRRVISTEARFRTGDASIRCSIRRRYWRKRVDVSLCTFESRDRIAPEPCQSLTGNPQLTLSLSQFDPDPASATRALSPRRERLFRR
jgi:hypothetical protein